MDRNKRQQWKRFQSRVSKALGAPDDYYVIKGRNEPDWEDKHCVYEMKHTKKLNLKETFKQCMAYRPKKIPVVIHQVPGTRTALVYIRKHDLYNLIDADIPKRFPDDYYTTILSDFIKLKKQWEG